MERLKSARLEPQCLLRGSNGSLDFPISASPVVIVPFFINVLMILTRRLLYSSLNDVVEVKSATMV